MLAISILLIFLLGALNGFNLFFTAGQTETLLSVLMERELAPQPPQFSPWPHAEHPKGNLFSPEMNENDALGAVFFAVRISGTGEVKEIRLDRIASVTEEEAAALTKKALESQRESGRIEQFRYLKKQSDGGTVCLFLDTTGQMHTVLRILLLSVLTGLGCWLTMLCIVILLSRKAIRPIAENIERQKQFVTDAGHEIKTPLAIILANTDAMELRTGETKWSKNIREQTLRLNGLMQNLLTLAKIDESSVNASKESVCLSKIIEQTADMFREAMEPKKLRYENQVDKEIYCMANKELIGRLFSILFDNAVKYSPVGGTVAAKLYFSDRFVRFSLSNSCGELPSCPPEKLFDRFYRADAARTQKSGGYGIGLSAAQTIAQLHGGTIRAEYSDANTIIFHVTL